MDTKWIHIGYIHWIYPWIVPGYFRDIFWIYSGYKVDTLWIHFGYISVDSSWIFFGYKVDTKWIHIGYISVEIPWIQNGYCYFAEHGSHSNHSRILILNICKIFSCANDQCMHLLKKKLQIFTSFAQYAKVSAGVHCSSYENIRISCLPACKAPTHLEKTSPREVQTPL